VGAGATRHRVTMSHRAYRPEVFGSFCLQKEQSFSKEFRRNELIKTNLKLTCYVS
jgi:hypothetical protein